MFRTVGGTVTYTALFGGVPAQSGGEQAPAAAERNGLWWLLFLPVGAAAAGLAVGGKALVKKYKAKKEWREFNQ